MAQSEKQAFSERLNLALKRARKKIATPSELATQFNLVYDGDPISPQAAQKWMTGLAKPTPDKIEILARMCSVSTQWLRYGIPEARPSKATTKRTAAAMQPTAEELKLLGRYRFLSEHQQKLVADIIEQFAVQQEMWQE